MIVCRKSWSCLLLRRQNACDYWTRRWKKIRKKEIKPDIERMIRGGRFKYFYLPEAWITYFTWSCWFLICSVERAILMVVEGGEWVYKVTLRTAGPTFWVKIAFALLVAISGPKKVLISGPTPSNGTCNGYCPHQNHYVPRHVNNRYIKGT